MDERKWKVLIIDDEEGIRKVLDITLTDAGYDVLTAAGGEEGLSLCEEAGPHIVITDIRMPGMDGLEVLRRIKRQFPDREVIVATAFGDMDVAVRALQLEASDFITKPIGNDALLVALERAKKRFRMRRELREYTELLERRLLSTAKELANTFDYQKNLIEGSMDGILGCDGSGKVLTYNRSLEAMLGIPKENAIGTMTFDHFFPVGSVENLWEAFHSEGYGGRERLFLYETHLLREDGGKVPVQLSLTLLQQDGVEMGWVGFFRDLREIRKLEQQFEDQARVLHHHKMMSLGRLAASVVHEINNPLAGILNYLRLMLKILNRDGLEDKHLENFKRYLSLVEGETRRCSEIVGNLLSFSRKSSLTFNDVDINEVLQKCILLSRHKLTLENIEVLSDLSPVDPKVRGDLNQLQQAIINLIFNAIDAMPGGGSLSLSSTHHGREGLVEIRVADTGRGIAGKDLPHIFDPFFTTRTEGGGLGLGLSTVYGIVDRHKGTVTVDSSEGQGTVFTIKIPAAKAPLS